GLKPKLKMPRKGEPLSSEAIAKLGAWIDAGAAWPDSASSNIIKGKDHWAFKAPVKPPVPVGAKHPIDAFIQAKLSAEGLKLAPKTGLPTLIRRLYLDLTGLPPEPKEVDRFIAEMRARPPSGLSSSVLQSSVYLRWVNDLLASPHYGERWGRQWLDAARYADSNGYEKDPMRYIWFYRDWVINAFNRDLPYDQFIIEQIAGDLLPGATQDQIVATGFLRNSMVNEEGGADPEQFRMESMFDRMDTIGKSILGLTIGCTQCHNHKYDPISQEEYYRMFAYLNSDSEPWRVVYLPAEQMKVAQIHQRTADLEAELKHSHPDWEKRMAEWEQTVSKVQPEWHVLQAPFIDDTTGGQKFLLQADGSYLAQSYSPTKATPKVEITGDVANITAFRLELLTDPNLPAYGPGRSQTGTCALTEFLVEADVDGKSEKLKFASATADFGEPENTPLVAYARDKDSDKDKRVTGPVSYAIDAKDDTAWGIDAGPGLRNQSRKAVFVLDKPLAKTSKLSIGLAMKHGGWNSDDLQNTNLGRFRISYTTAANAKADPLPAKVREILAVAPDKRTPAQLATVFSYWRTTVADWKPVNEAIALAWKDHPEGTTTLVLDKREQPRMTTILKRGDFLKPGDKVTTGVPAILNPLPKNADNSRLTFAKWMVNRKSPTTARALVNRVWQSYFGTGLVNTPEDFGTQGETPVYRELLDWLATEFMDRGWSIKELQRIIVTSATYQQDSHVTPEMVERDPYNRLLARGPRFRVEGELIRDIQLSVSGLLNPAMGGRSVMPPAPAFLFDRPASYAPFPWKDEVDSNQYRRAVYTFRRRSTPYPFLSTFDVPSAESSCVRRPKSNTPLQALMTLNETMSMAAAEALAKRMVKEGGDDESRRIAHGFKLCTGRAPNAFESKALTGLLHRQVGRVGDDKADAYTVVARVLLNLDETITKE
ncbi:MAG: Protein of unknown function (DUF1553)/Protein of unknown function (DUF1549)/Planctomycete, partial [Verrucomicrobiaceae bacterium]|nr:Protein of unknown function (DUF1553)/Protein of unknown function (DUF1549)/Planctomycete [Verrucomicrobiaceae bacterium]